MLFISVFNIYSRLKMSYIGKQKSPMGYIQKRIPRSKRYGNISGSLNTGASVRRTRYVSAKEHARRQAEIFKRCRPRELADLMEERRAESASKAEEEKEEKRVEMDVIAERKRSNEDWRMDRFVVIDVRSGEDFAQCRVTGAVHFPLDCVKQDRFPPFMYSFKRDPSKLIVVYGNGEKDAAVAATIMVEKGYESCVMLSGGLRYFGNRHPEFISGTMPGDLRLPESPRKPSHRIRERRQRDDPVLSPRGRTPRSGYAYSDAGYSTLSHSSAVSVRSTFSRAKRWSYDAPHREIISKLHHSPGQ